jgi:hypothetical protein
MAAFSGWLPEGIDDVRKTVAFLKSRGAGCPRG